MSLDASRADLIIQYALLLAGEEDDIYARQLGPIHLVKYAYLADLHFAKRHSHSFTGAAWRFHHFGPWDADVFDRIEPATQAIQAEQARYESNYGDEDWVRYRLRDSELLHTVEKTLPPAITLQLRREVHRFLGDTPSLLDYVYKTKPMLCAAPSESLDLSTVAERKEDHDNTNARNPARTSLDDTAGGLRMEKLSNKKRKRFHEAVSALRKKDLKHPRLINPVSAPRFDEVFEEGLDWLDGLAGSPKLEQSEWLAEFSEDVWKSSARKGEDVS